MGSIPRRTMCLDLTVFASQPESKIGLRQAAASDACALGSLMFEAFRGTIDDTGEPLDAALVEVALTFEGGYGPLIWEASLVAHDAGLLVSACLVTFWRGAPLLAFSMTHPAARGRGLAGALIQASAQALQQLSYQKLMLAVTKGNAPAEHLYQKLGFYDAEPSQPAQP